MKVVQETEPVQVTEVVATVLRVSGHAPEDDQYARPPIVGVVDVEMVPTPLPPVTEALKVVPSNERLEPMRSDLIALDPLPTKIPPSGVVLAVPPLAIATVPVTFAAVPPMLSVLVETEYKVPLLAPTTPASEPSVGSVENVLVPLQVLELARRVVEAMVMSVEPLKETPLMRRAVARVVAVLALPPMESEEVAVVTRAPALLV